jgi:hypothetical protein
MGQVSPEISMLVLIKYRFSDSPLELVTVLLPIKGAEQETTNLGFSGSGETSNLTYRFFPTLKTSMCWACKTEVCAPVSIFAFIAGKLMEGRQTHSSHPRSNCMVIDRNNIALTY